MGEAGFPRRVHYLLPRNKYIAVVALAALLLSVIGLTDAVQLPFVSSLGGSASGGVSSLGALSSLLNIGYAGLFALMVMESASIPIPSEVVLPFAGYLVFVGKLSLLPAILDSSAALVVGALIDYYLALWLGRPVVYRVMQRVGVSPSRLDDGERWIDSKGSVSVFVARFVPGLRSVISIPAGLFKMRMVSFVLLTLAGSVIWSAILVYAGYSAGPLWQSSLDSLSTVADEVALLAVAAISVFYVVYYLGPFGRER